METQSRCRAGLRLRSAITSALLFAGISMLSPGHGQARTVNAVQCIGEIIFLKS